MQRPSVGGTLWLILALGVALFSVRLPASGIEGQFTITLPDGWSAYDQNRAVFKKESPYGIVVFSAQPVTKPGEATADAALLAQVDRGDIPSFFVDRSAAGKGAKCEQLSKTEIYNIGTSLNQDPRAGGARRMFGGGIAPKHTDTSIGGCKGVKFFIESNKDNPEKHWIIDVRAVSDGKVRYLFSLRNRGENYPKNLDTYEKALETLRFVATSSS
jgi:hypothetical protein